MAKSRKQTAASRPPLSFGSAVERQLSPPNSQISKMIGRGIPISHSSNPRPIAASKAFVAG
jgi:hypothetical protein